MKTEKIQELKKFWGDKPCLHPLLKKAAVSADKICTTCGRTVYSPGIIEPVKSFWSLQG